MPTPTSCEELFLRALESAAGIAVPFDEERLALAARFSLYKWRNALRKRNRRLDPTSPMWNRTDFDHLTINIKEEVRRGTPPQPPIYKVHVLRITHAPIAALAIEDINPEDLPHA